MIAIFQRRLGRKNPGLARAQSATSKEYPIDLSVYLRAGQSSCARENPPSPVQRESASSTATENLLKQFDVAVEAVVNLRRRKCRRNSLDQIGRIRWSIDAIRNAF